MGINTAEVREAGSMLVMPSTGIVSTTRVITTCTIVGLDRTDADHRHGDRMGMGRTVVERMGVGRRGITCGISFMAIEVVRTTPSRAGDRMAVEDRAGRS